MVSNQKFKVLEKLNEIYIYSNLSKYNLHSSRTGWKWYVTKWIRSPRIAYEVLNMKPIIILLKCWLLKLWAIYGQKNYFTKRHFLRHNRGTFPLSSHPSPHFVKSKPKDAKIGLALTRLIDIITLKDTYTLKRERDAQHEVVKHRIRLQQKRISLTWF